MRRRRLLIVLAGAAALAPPALVAHAAMQMPGARRAAAPTVSIGFDAYQPAQVDVLAGETVQWMNDSARQHTVTAEDGAFDSGRIGLRRVVHAQPSTRRARYRVYCRLHPSMRGEIDVHRVLLDAPGAPAGAGRAYPLRGRAALPAGLAGLDRGDDSGDGLRRGGAGDGRRRRDVHRGRSRPARARATAPSPAATHRPAVRAARARPYGARDGHAGRQARRRRRCASRRLPRAGPSSCSCACATASAGGR